MVSTLFGNSTDDVPDINLPIIYGVRITGDLPDRAVLTMNSGNNRVADITMFFAPHVNRRSTAEFIFSPPFQSSTSRITTSNTISQLTKSFTGQYDAYLSSGTFYNYLITPQDSTGANIGTNFTTCEIIYYNTLPSI